MAKSPSAFRTISEAAEEVGAPQHVLRFWETKFDFIVPVKRAGGRRFYRPDDVMVLKAVRRLLHDEGLCVGGSSGINVAGAIRLARELGPGHTVVTVLCDGGGRYQSKLFNPAFLREKGLPTPAWLDR